MKAIKHFKTIMSHKWLVMRGCFKVGLFWQGILHDMSKFSLVEFYVGCKFFQGNRSPNNAEREEKGCSYSWLHHKGRNKHHFEYWIDYGMHGIGGMTGMKMPVKYVIEMTMDRIAASKVYGKDSYTDISPLEYYITSKDKIIIHDDTRKLLEELLQYLAENGEEELFRYIKNEVLKNGYVSQIDLQKEIHN